jgi:hypothetical protein
MMIDSEWTSAPLQERTWVICDEAHVGSPADGPCAKNAAEEWTSAPLQERTWVICDEAHVGNPADGPCAKNAAEAALGAAS